MKEQGVKSLTELDPFERSKLVDGCLERRIKSGKLLEMVPPQPYFSGRLAKIIRKATAIEAVDRYQDAFEFHNALQAFSGPQLEGCFCRLRREFLEGMGLEGEFSDLG
jgi:hypothetical protein